MSHRADFFVAAQRMLPKHALSRMIGRSGRVKTPMVKKHSHKASASLPLISICKKLKAIVWMIMKVLMLSLLGL